MSGKSIKNIIFYTAIVAVFLSIPLIVSAQPVGDCDPNNSGVQLCNPLSAISKDSSGNEKGLPRVINYLLVLLVVFTTGQAIVWLVFSGFKMIISQGESEKIEKAKQIFIWPIYGMILVLMSFVIVAAIVEFLGVSNIPDTAFLGTTPAPVNPLDPISPTFGDLITRMLIRFLQVVGLVALLMIVISGFRYITSAGNEELAASAKTSLQWAAMGLGVIILSYVIVRAVATFFGG